MKYTIWFLLICTSISTATAQETGDVEPGKINYSVSGSAYLFSDNRVPFWMRTNKFGAVPLKGFSSIYGATASKDYNSDKEKFDWGFGLDAQLFVGKNGGPLLIEAYVKAKIKSFQIKIGRSKDVIGIMDTTLSSGSFSVSGNALGIPKVEVSVPEYVELPFTKGVIFFKGNFAYGLVGNEPIAQLSYIKANTAFTNFHQKSLYVRIGREDSKFKVSGGFNHNVTWGDENEYFRDWNLSSFSTLLKATTGGVYKKSKIGNHVGSIDQKVEYGFGNAELGAYHQFFYEVGGLAHLNNLKDGLWGLEIRNKDALNKKIAGRCFIWNKFLFEFLATKSQGGELDAKITPSGDEDYYNNYLYLNGWKYHSENLGNNFVTNKDYMRKDLPVRDYESHGNNRLYLFHFGTDISLGKTNIITKLSYSNNFGTYGTSPEGNTTGSIRTIGPPPYFSRVNQFSGYLKINRWIKNFNNIGLEFSLDNGELLYNSVGLGVSFTRKW